MFLTIFFILIFLLVTYLLLVPIILIIDTATNQYYVQLKGLIKASLHQDEEELIKLKIHILFWNLYFYPLKKNGSAKKKNAKKNSVKKKKNKLGFRTILRMLKSFRVKKIILDIDTGDCISNAKLFPVFEFLRYTTKGSFRVNFEGRNQMALCIKNRPIDIIKSFVKF